MDLEEDNTSILVKTIPLVGVCNLCLNNGGVKSMLIKQKHDVIVETYIEMILWCFSIDMFTVELGDTERLICNSCIIKLIDCIQLRKKVLDSLKTLQETVKKQDTIDYAVSDIKQEYEELGDVTDKLDDAVSEIKQEYEEIEDVTDNKVLLAEVKKEVLVAHLLWDGEVTEKHQDRIDDVVCDIKRGYEEIGYFAEFTEVVLNDNDLEDYKTKKTRRKTLPGAKQKLSYSVKKKLDTSETEKMLQTGLFPFKMYKDCTYSCVICTERSNSLEDIRKHVNVHTIQHLHHAFKKLNSSKLQRFAKAAFTLRCKLCKTDICDFDQLSKHLKSCSRLSHVCDICGKSFSSKARIRVHMRTHALGSFPCRYCGSVFDTVKRRENHVAKDHKAGLRYACKRCNITLPSFYTRQKHLAEVHNEELKRYKCNACTQSYITPSHLSSHVRRAHLNERSHQCDKCDMAFYTRNSLKMHKITHDGERIHSCHVCHKSYQRMKTLREHLRIHNNDKRFVCPVCDRAFTQKSTLKGHLKVHD